MTCPPCQGLLLWESWEGGLEPIFGQSCLTCATKPMR